MKHHQQQRGITFIGILFVGVVVACAGILAAQVAPTLIEFQAITKAASKAASGNNAAEVRAIFDKAGAVDDIHSISGKDLQLTKEGEKTVVAFAYTREIHMAGPAFLLLKYTGRSK
jgi:Domain of unknown function (DUF4845)